MFRELYTACENDSLSYAPQNYFRHECELKIIIVPERGGEKAPWDLGKRRIREFEEGSTFEPDFRG